MKYKFGTHDGSFHADEVTALALLIVFIKLDPSKTIRTRDLEILKDKPSGLSYEGYLAPDTYRIYKHATIEEVVAVARERAGVDEDQALVDRPRQRRGG